MSWVRGVAAAITVAFATSLGGAPASSEGSAADPAVDRIGHVGALTGPATVVRDGRPSALHIDAAIYATDRVRTFDRAKLKILFEDGSRLVLGANSVVEIARYAPADDGRGLVGLIQGAIRVLLDRAGAWREFDVETAHAVASARSTEWVVVLSPDGTAVFVVGGRVAVAAQGRRVTLGPGQGTDVPPGAPPQPVATWGQARVDDVLARTTLP
jgi:ferric-dicitrate binding protein FerR (iron transport regulator)